MTGEFKSSYLLLKVPDILEFSVGISGLDFKKINKELSEEKTKRDEILKKTQCEDEANLRDKLKDKNNLEKHRDQLIYETNRVLDGRKYEDLIKEAESLNLSISSLTSAVFSMYKSFPGTYASGW